eukprot:scaffold11_cov257-Pinguiococcus_pyrenoidosus.AAC.7
MLITYRGQDRVGQIDGDGASEAGVAGLRLRHGLGGAAGLSLLDPASAGEAWREAARAVGLLAGDAFLLELDEGHEERDLVEEVEEDGHRGEDAERAEGWNDRGGAHEEGREVGGRRERDGSARACQGLPQLGLDGHVRIADAGERIEDHEGVVHAEAQHHEDHRVHDQTERNAQRQAEAEAGHDRAANGEDGREAKHGPAVELAPRAEHDAGVDRENHVGDGGELRVVVECFADHFIVAPAGQGPHLSAIEGFLEALRVVREVLLEVLGLRIGLNPAIELQILLDDPLEAERAHAREVAALVASDSTHDVLRLRRAKYPFGVRLGSLVGDASALVPPRFSTSLHGKTHLNLSGQGKIVVHVGLAEGDDPILVSFKGGLVVLPEAKDALLGAAGVRADAQILEVSVVDDAVELDVFVKAEHVANGVSVLEEVAAAVGGVVHGHEAHGLPEVVVDEVAIVGRLGVLRGVQLVCALLHLQTQPAEAQTRGEQQREEDRELGPVRDGLAEAAVRVLQAAIDLVREFF